MLDLTIGFIVTILVMSIGAFLITEKWHDWDEFCEWLENEKKIRWYWKHWADNLPKREHMKSYNPWYYTDKQVKKIRRQEKRKAHRATNTMSRLRMRG